MKALILAGGLGTRLRSVVSDVPKPMAPVRGRPFLAYLLDHWLAQGVESFVLSLGHKAEIVEAYFGSAYRGHPLFYVREEFPLGTGGALLRAWKSSFLRKEECFLAMNGDSLLDVSLLELERFPAADFTLAIRAVPENTRFGSVITARDGRVRHFSAGASGGPAWINGGVYLVRSAFMESLQEELEPVSLENSILPRAISEGAFLYAARTTGRFLDIGLPEDYALAPTFLAEEPGASTRGGD